MCGKIFVYISRNPPSLPDIYTKIEFKHMATARPFAYNIGAPIAGTEQVGSLAVGYPTSGFVGLPWWNGPDEELGYVIAKSVPGNNQPVPVGTGKTGASVGFLRSPLLTEASFVNLANYVAAGATSWGPTGGTAAKAWLNSNGYWTSWTDTYKYDSGTNLTWPASSAGYTLYNGGFTSADDGYSNSAITLPTIFETNNQASNQLFLSTNGYFTLTTGSSGIYSTPQGQPDPALMCANPSDNWMQPGLVNSDGDTQNWYYKTGSDGGDKYYAKLLVYAGTFGATTTPTSYIINFYRDSTFEWLETRVKSNTRGNAGPYNAVDVSQPSSTTSQVWRGDLNGQNWVYMGTGSIVP